MKLEGIRSNRAALGARIRLVVDTGKGERSIYKTVSSGGSFGSSPLRQSIGLGDVRSIRSAEIYWPTTGETQEVAGLELDRFYRIREGESAPEVWNLKAVRVPTGARALHTAGLGGSLGWLR